jgi:hypothetical protein
MEMPKKDPLQDLINVWHSCSRKEAKQKAISRCVEAWRVSLKGSKSGELLSKIIRLEAEIEALIMFLSEDNYKVPEEVQTFSSALGDHHKLPVDKLS